MKHKEQRVGVFIDVANMYYSARSEYDAHVNFGKVVETAVAGRQLIRAIAYAVKADMPEEQSFFEALNKMGIEVNTKDLQTFYDGSQKGNVDMELAIDALKLAPKLDVVVLVSGDGDYRILMEHLKTLGCRVEVIGFGRSVSSKLIDVAHDFINLEDDVRDYLIKSKASKSKKSARRTAKARQTTQRVASSRQSESASTSQDRKTATKSQTEPVTRTDPVDLKRQSHDKKKSRGMMSRREIDSLAAGEMSWKEED